VPLCALVSISSQFAGMKNLRMSDLRGTPVVCYNDPVLFDALTQIINRDNIVMTTSSTLTLSKELENNRAITFVPKIAHSSELPQDTLLKCLKDSFTTKVGFLGVKGSLGEPCIASVISYIRDFFVAGIEQKNFQDVYELL